MRDRMKKTCIYTCITGTYDKLKKIVKEKNIDYYCFTNNKNIKSNNWNVIYIENEELDDVRLARKIKILGHPILKKYKITIWVDGSIEPKKMKEYLSKECNLKKYSYIGILHHSRNCIYDEAKACKEAKKDKIATINKQMNYYKKMKFPKNFGLHDTCIIIRKNNDKLVDETMKIWFENIMNFSRRDQLSQMWSVYKTGLEVQSLDIKKYDNKYFKLTNHDAGFDIGQLFFEYNNNFDEQHSIKSKYSISNQNRKKVVFNVPYECKNIRFDPANVDSYYISNIKINGKSKNFSTNCKFKNGKYIFINDDPYFLFNGNFKINDKIVIEFNYKKTKDVKYMILRERNCDYFFQKIKDEIYSIYKLKNRERTLKLLNKPNITKIERIIIRNGLEKWKNKIKSLDFVLIFDAFYTSRISEYIKKKNKKCKIYLYFWNDINFNNEQILSDKNIDSFFTFNKEDSLKHNIIYYNQFYTKDLKLRKTKEKYDIIFLGRDKGRKESIDKINQISQNLNLKTKFIVINEEKDYMDYFEYLKNIVQKTKCILDYSLNTKSGYSLRVMESIFFNKKLITNNINFKYNHYKNNIFFINDVNNINEKDLIKFLNSEFKNYDEEIKTKYDYFTWIEKFVDYYNKESDYEK